MSGTLPIDWPSRDDNVGAHFAGTFERAERNHFCHDGNQQRALFACAASAIGVKIAHIAENIRRLNDDAGRVLVIDLRSNVFAGLRVHAARATTSSFTSSRLVRVTAA